MKQNKKREAGKICVECKLKLLVIPQVNAKQAAVCIT